MDHVPAVCRSALRGCIEARDDGGKRIRLDGRTCYRSLPANKTIGTLFGRVTYARSRYRTASRGSSFVPVDESPGLVDGYLTVPAAYRAVLVLDHCSSRDTAALFEKPGGMNPSASQLHRLGDVAGRLWKERGRRGDGRDPQGGADTGGGACLVTGFERDARLFEFIELLPHLLFPGRVALRP